MFNVIILGIASFLTGVSSEMVYPLLPLCLASARIGASPTIAGLIEGFTASAAGGCGIVETDLAAQNA